MTSQERLCSMELVRGAHTPAARATEFCMYLKFVGTRQGTVCHPVGTRQGTVCHPSGTRNLEAAATFLEQLCAPATPYSVYKCPTLPRKV